ncbi:hypothetical protein BN12_1900001 [Nostocoides japonicum T1-X7]|uniref:Uncharacterized protein n=1 Tax=Nostocoides japonicum T1-X7 TaxID=1194083 RepID=A0A077LZM7_9MICO|nr:hypothetical protein BN12_1900001 [Tetrasphaera japonica T1-X7]
MHGAPAESRYRGPSGGSPHTSTAPDPPGVEVSRPLRRITTYLDRARPSRVEVTGDLPEGSSYLDSQGVGWIEVSGDAAS